MEIWAATRDPAAAGHPFPAPYSVQTLLDELQMRPVVVRGRRARRRSTRSPARPSASSRSRSGARPGSTRSTRSWRRCRSSLSEPARGELPALSRRRGCSRSCSRSRTASCPEPYVQSPESVAVHEVELRGDGSRGSSGRRSRGAAARSRPRSRPRAPRVEIAEGRLAAPGVAPPELAVEDPEAFLGLLDTEVRWQVRDLSRSCDRHVTVSPLCCRSWQRRRQHRGDRRRSSRS